MRTYVALPRGRLRGRVGGESQPRPKPRPITSPDRPGPPLFLRACNIEKSGVAWGRGYTVHTHYTLITHQPCRQSARHTCKLISISIKMKLRIKYRISKTDGQL